VLSSDAEPGSPTRQNCRLPRLRRDQQPRVGGRDTKTSMAQRVDISRRYDVVLDRSAARRLTTVGALLCAASVVTPWYALEAHGLSGESMSGARALGVGRTILVLVLAVLAAWPGTARLHRLLPFAAAVVLCGVVASRVAFHPSAAKVIPTSGSSDALTSQLERGFASALVQSVDLHWSAAWGIWVAALGAALTVVSTATRVRVTGRRRSRDR